MSPSSFNEGDAIAGAEARPARSCPSPVEVSAGDSRVSSQRPGASTPESNLGGAGDEDVVLRRSDRAHAGERPVHFLLVDDDDVDVMAVERAFSQARIRNPMVVARDGREALDVLRGTGGREPMPEPYLILLDLHMPGMGGIEFLQALRDDPKLRKAVVFVFTSSKDEQHRLEAYHYNVAGFIIKSHMSRDFRRMAEMLHMYWNLVELP
ncbi:MAG: response regulator [Phycisphaerae bacterium]|nr:response regulator [Phycisphaerae bacterium]